MSLKEEAKKKKWYWITPLILAILVSGSWVYLTPTEKYDVCQVGSEYGEWVNTTETFYVNDQLSALGKYRCELENKEIWCGSTTATRCYYILEENFIPKKLYYMDFNLSFDNKLEVSSRDSLGTFGVDITAFIEGKNGKRVNIALNENNLPFMKVDDKNYKYNITFDITSDVKYLGLEFNISPDMDFDVGDFNEYILISREDTGLLFDLKDIENYEYKIGNNELLINVEGLDTLHIDPTVTFSTEYVECGDIAPLDEDTFVITWCDETANDIEFRIYDADGTLIGSQVTVNNDIALCAYKPPSAAAFNSTHFVIGYFDGTDDDVSFNIFNSSGSEIVSETDVDTTAGSLGLGVSVSAFNDTHFVIGWFDDQDNDVSFAVYKSDGTLIGSKDIDTSATSANGGISVSAFNDTHFVVGWFDGGSGDVSFAIYDSEGNELVSAVDVDEDVGAGAFATSVSVFNTTHFVIGWYDYTNKDITFAIGDSSGNILVSETDADTNVGSSFSVLLSTLNTTHFAIGWWDDVDDATQFAVYDSGGNSVVSVTNSSDESINYFVPVASQEVATGIAFCNNNFVHGFAKSITSANWTAYQPDGTSWDGTCEVGGTPDVNFTYGPSDTTLVRIGTCGPDFENATAEPENQTASKGIYYLCNNGTATGDLQIKWSGTSATNWTLYASNTSISASLLTESTSYVTIYDDLAQDACTYVWLKANCSYVGNPPGVYEEFQIV